MLRSFLKSPFTKSLAILVVAGLMAVVVLPQSQKEFLKEVPVVGTWAYGQTMKLGLDLQGGTRLTYRVLLDTVPAKDQDTVIRSVMDILTRRVNGIGVSEPNIYESRAGNERQIVVELAGIKDIEEAKKIVGKTIQLDFKEQDQTQNPKVVADVTKKAQDFFAKVKTRAADFDKVFEDYKETPRITLVTDQDWKWLNDMPEADRGVIAKTAVGGVVDKLMEPAPGQFVMTASKQAVQQTGYSVYKVLEKEENADRTQVTKESRSAKHALVAFKGASKADASVTRTEDEARILAEEVLAKAKSGTDVGVLAKEYSDEPNAETSGGDLGSFGRGSMVPAFEQAVFDMGAPGLVDRIVRSDFGYHVIQVTDIQPETSTTTKETRLKLERAEFSTVPDGWKSTGLTGQHFRKADVGTDPTTMKPVVNIRFTDTAIASNAVNWLQLAAGLVAMIAGVFFIFSVLGLLTYDGTGSKLLLYAGTALSFLVLAGSIVLYMASATPAAKPVADTEGVATSETDKAGVDLFKEITEQNVGKPVAIFLDGLPIIDTNGDGVIDAKDPAYAPVIREVIGGGQATISGLVSLKEAYELTNNLNTGAIPAPIKLSSEQTIGASLGETALTQSLKAGLIGLIAIIVFMTVTYRLPGLVSGLALVIYTVLLTFLTQYFGIVMTLAGIAGIILSMGMAVDANVLIFARMKEEMRNGKALDLALRDGFARAWTSIWAGHISTLLTCMILFVFGSSMIKGFAITLSLGIIVSLFSAIVVTRVFLRTLLRTPVKHLKVLF